jgi:hypothetical protein
MVITFGDKIAFWFIIYRIPDIIYGRFYIGMCAGKYMVGFSQKNKLSICNYFGTGQGG